MPRNSISKLPSSSSIHSSKNNEKTKGKNNQKDIKSKKQQKYQADEPLPIDDDSSDKFSDDNEESSESQASNDANDNESDNEELNELEELEEDNNELEEDNNELLDESEEDDNEESDESENEESENEESENEESENEESENEESENEESEIDVDSTIAPKVRALKANFAQHIGTTRPQKEYKTTTRNTSVTRNTSATSSSKIPSKTYTVKEISNMMPNIIIEDYNDNPLNIDDVGELELDDLLQKESSESVNNFEIRKRLTYQISKINATTTSTTASTSSADAFNRPNNVTSVILGHMIMKKMMLGVKYSQNIENVIEFLVTSLKRMTA